MGPRFRGDDITNNYFFHSNVKNKTINRSITQGSKLPYTKRSGHDAPEGVSSTDKTNDIASEIHNVTIDHFFIQNIPIPDANRRKNPITSIDKPMIAFAWLGIEANTLLKDAK